LMLLCGLFLITGLGIGLLVSTIANNQQEAMLTVYMTILPTIFLSGFFFPVEAMPKILQWISYFIPMRYFLVIIRSVLLKGTGIAPLKGEVLALVAFAIVIMAAAILRFRKRLD
jgi:ABC-2 type transport system permease protein